MPWITSKIFDFTKPNETPTIAKNNKQTNKKCKKTTQIKPANKQTINEIDTYMYQTYRFLFLRLNGEMCALKITTLKYTCTSKSWNVLFVTGRSYSCWVYLFSQRSIKCVPKECFVRWFFFVFFLVVFIWYRLRRRMIK